MSDDQGNFFDAEPPEEPDPARIYYGREPSETEAMSGKAIYADREPDKPLQPGKKGHETLRALADLVIASGYRYERWTAYEVSRRLCGDGHGARRELKRLEARLPPLVRKDGTKSNVGVVVNGRDHVDAFAMTPAGWAELSRLDRELQ